MPRNSFQVYSGVSILSQRLKKAKQFDTLWPLQELVHIVSYALKHFSFQFLELLWQPKLNAHLLQISEVWTTHWLFWITS